MAGRLGWALLASTQLPALQRAGRGEIRASFEQRSRKGLAGVCHLVILATTGR